MTILALGLVAAIGRAIQLRAFGPISPFSHVLLEVIIEGSRIMLVLYALGLANIKSGFAKLIRVVKSKEFRRRNGRVAIIQLRHKWHTILINLVAFLLIAYVFNLLIDHIAYETCLYITLLGRQLISEQSSVWVLILFFKNVSVIPFTLVFQSLFLLWLTNRLPDNPSLTLGGNP